MATPNIFLLCKNKIIVLDYLAPLVLELERRFGKLPFRLVFPDVKSYKYYRKNTTLIRLFKQVGVPTYVMRRGNLFFSCLDYARLGKSILGKNNVFLKLADTLPRHKEFVSVAKKLGSATEIFVSFKIPPLATQERINQIDALCFAKRGDVWQPSHEQNDYDYRFYPVDEAERDGLTDPRLLRVGYPRRFPAWLDFVKNEQRSFRETVGGDYSFFVLSCLNKRFASLDEPDGYDALVETLRALKPFCRELKTVFRPAPITDMDKFHRAVHEADFANYVVSYAHPVVIGYGAKFVIGNSYSTVFADCCYLRRPVIDYFKYDPDATFLEGGSEGGPVVQHTIHMDPEELQRTVSNILAGRTGYTYTQEDLDVMYPETPDSFWDFWAELLGRPDRTRGEAK